jgi:uncharacterized membrane protein YesL
LEFKGIMGGLYRISEWIMRLAVINVLWILCSIPVFFIAFVGLTSAEPGAMLSSLPVMAIFVPFTLFPATAAMFTVARKWVTGDEDVPLLKTFFKGYRENYVQSMIGGILFMLIFAVIYVNYYFYLRQGGTLRILSILFIAFTVIVATAMFHFFSIMVHLHMKVMRIIKNAILITVGNPLNSAALIIFNGVILYVSLFTYTFLIPFFMGSLIASFSFWQFHRMFQKLQMKQQELGEQEGLPVEVPADRNIDSNAQENASFSENNSQLYNDNQSEHTKANKE